MGLWHLPAGPGHGRPRVHGRRPRGPDRRPPHVPRGVGREEEPHVRLRALQVRAGLRKERMRREL